MTQEEKELLVLKDLSARLPYGVKAHYIVHHVIENEYDEWDAVVDDLSDFIPGCKLYLRPMSSMTKTEYEEYDSYRKHICDEYNRYCFDSVESIDWLNKNGFDYRGLIPMGLALEAPKDMYKF